MSTAIIVCILVVIVAMAVRSSIRHFKGQGGCCGGGGDDRPEKKVLEGETIARKVLRIEGMHCQNCQNSVERQLNRIEGAAARADYRRKRAVVTMDREIADEELVRAVERAGFKVVGIE